MPPGPSLWPISSSPVERHEPRTANLKGVRHVDVLAFRCDSLGTVVEVVADDLQLDHSLQVGEKFQTIMDPHSLEKADQFLATVLSRQAASGWELNVCQDGRPTTAVFTATMQEDQIFVVVGRATRDISAIVDTLEQINNDQLNTFRMAFRDQLDQFDSRLRSGASAYEELSRLHNELSNAQRELSLKTNELARLNELKNRFLGIAAHDLRNPLSVILGYAGFLALLDEAEPDKKRAYDEIASSSRFMLDLINDLLDVSRIEAGQHQLQISSFDGMDLLRRTVDSYTRQASTKEIRLNIKGAEESIPMTSDTGMLRRVLGNLVSNAIKYSPSGTSVEVTVRQKGSHLLIEVRDQGIGVPADQLEAIFQPFVHLSNQGTGGERSTGLGLSIVAQLVSLLNGTIEVESQLGLGSTFRLMVPLVVGSPSR